MIDHAVVFTGRARRNLLAIHDWIEEKHGPRTAQASLKRLETFCLGLRTFPHRGTAHPEFGAGVRFVPWRRHATIVIRIDAETVTVLGIFPAGRDVMRALRGRD